jgi:hypothetical protein
MGEPGPPTEPPPPKQPFIAHISCPQCRYDKAVVAATHYALLMCFCPACEHVWDRDDPPG